MTALVNVEGLSLSFHSGSGWTRVLHQVSFAIERGEVLGLVGESGCGKSTIGLSLLGYKAKNARIDGGRVLYKGQDLLRLERQALDRLRGNRIGFVPQNPTTALNPSMRAGEQLAETLYLHGQGDQLDQRLKELFGLVGLAGVERITERYPHELSGGQQQRVCIAIALACNPDLVVLDEPTTGLDVTTQEQIIALLHDLRARLGMAMLYVTHDLALLAQIADRIGVMYAGYLVEMASTRRLFEEPRHPYTRGLIGSLPRVEAPGADAPAPLRGLLRRRELPPGCPFSPRCPLSTDRCVSEPQPLALISEGHAVACWRWPETGLLAATVPAPAASSPGNILNSLLELRHVSIAYGVRPGLLGRFLPGRPFAAVSELSFVVGRGETFALVGESGSGKSTVARAVSGLLPPRSGLIHFDGKVLEPLVQDRTSEERRRIQYIFQNPDASLNPRARIGRILARPVELWNGGDVRAKVAAALADVRLDSAYATRFPDELSGGERQRVAIARALVAEPDLLICDEVLSALDVSVQANILNLLRRLRRELNLAMLFISHDLAVVRSIADRVAVLFRGELMSLGPVERIFAPPHHPYTLSLLEAVPRIERIETPRPRAPAMPSAASMAPKCAYAGRCAFQLGRTCIDHEPPWQETSGGVRIRCHIPIADLMVLSARDLKPKVAAENVA
jgi:peptide/nickel transport system ATP-binding protein